ncbi:MAG TPA: cytochrome c oxidase assembly protein [Dongiaceae bacterium]|nr:cytochrome c oxidase assembly protein [Dongiaceae bacterium]
MNRNRRRNAIVVLGLVGLLAGSTALVVASIPLYRLFCQVTGYGGYTQRAEMAPQAVPGKTVTIRFDANVNSALHWQFQPEQPEMTLEIGETGLALYRVHNLTNERIVGTATFNVTPFIAGEYFTKIECFCFTEQVLEPGASADLPVTFFVDPRMLEDPETRDIHTITLSYTFYRAEDDPSKVSSAAPTVESRTGAGQKIN